MAPSHQVKFAVVEIYPGAEGEGKGEGGGARGCFLSRVPSSWMEPQFKRLRPSDGLSNSFEFIPLFSSFLHFVLSFYFLSLFFLQGAVHE